MGKNTTSGPVAPRRGEVNRDAWARNQVLADALAAARARVAEARQAGVAPSVLRRLERAENEAAERLYTSNLGIARRAAHAYLGRSRDQEELLAVADEALWKAIVSWDPSSSPLANWAFRVVEKACLVHVARAEHGLTAWAWAHRPAVRDAIAALESDGSPVTTAAVAELAGCTPELAQMLVSHEYHGRPRSLEAAAGPEGTALIDLLAVESDGIQIDDLDQMASATGDLPAGDLAMWIRFHGLDGAPAWTTKSLEQMFGVSDETVRRRIKAADAHVLSAVEAHVLSPRTLAVVDMGEVVAGLREFASSRGAPPTLECVRAIVGFLKGGSMTFNGQHMGLYDGPDRLGSALGLTGDEVCDLVASLGTFLGQSFKHSHKRAAVWGDDIPSSTVSETGMRKGRELAEQLSLLPFHAGDQVVLFGNWEARSTGRNLRQAVPNIVNTDVDDALLNRWMLRQWANPAVVVSFELVSMVWMLAKLGRAGELGALARIAGTGQPSLARALADAWDLLEVSRAQAVEAVERLCAGNHDADEVLAEVARCRWLAEAEIGRVEKAARRVAQGEPTGALPDAVAQFAANAAGRADMHPTTVAELNDGQVRRLAEAFSLDTDGDRALRLELNHVVTKAGLRADADRLISLGVAAHRAGLAEAFAAALERRRHGDIGWADELHEQLGVS